MIEDGVGVTRSNSARCRSGGFTPTLSEVHPEHTSAKIILIARLQLRDRRGSLDPGPAIFRSQSPCQIFVHPPSGGNLFKECVDMRLLQDVVLANFSPYPECIVCRHKIAMREVCASEVEGPIEYDSEHLESGREDGGAQTQN